MNKAIYWKDKEKLMCVLEEVQKKCRTNMCDYTDIEYGVTCLEELFGRIPKCHRKGLKIRINKHAQKYPNSYKGIPMSTYITYVYKQRGWYVSNITREPCDTVYMRTLVFPEEAKEALLKSYMTSENPL